MAVSYRQILLERDGQPLNQSQVKLVLRQALSQLQAYHDRQQAHGGVSLTTLHQVPHGCHLAPPTHTPTNSTPQEDVIALARAAITLLTGYPPSPDWHWQAHGQMDARLRTILEQMLAGRFTQAGQVLLVLEPEEVDPTEMTPMRGDTPTVAMTPPPQTIPAVAPTAPSVSAPPTGSAVPLAMLLLGLGWGGFLALTGGWMWFVLSRQSQPSETPTPVVVAPAPSPTVSPVAPPKHQVGGGVAGVATPVSHFSADDGVALVESWLDAKKTIFAPPYDLDLAASFLTGPAWRDVSKPNGSVDWLKTNNTYYRYGGNRVSLRRVIQADSHRLVLDLDIQEQLSIYRDGRLRQTKTDRDTYRFDLRRVGDRWKIYDRRTVK
ncbi:MAG: IMS domain-containing protein [Gloeomargarita sp. HHBFW_bins_162]